MSAIFSISWKFDQFSHNPLFWSQVDTKKWNDGLRSPRGVCPQGQDHPYGIDRFITKKKISTKMGRSSLARKEELVFDHGGSFVDENTQSRQQQQQQQQHQLFVV